MKISAYCRYECHFTTFVAVLHASNHFINLDLTSK